MAIVQTESLIRSDERGKIKKHIQKVIDNPLLTNLHSKMCGKNLSHNPIEWKCDCDVLEFLNAVEAVQ